MPHSTTHEGSDTEASVLTITWDDNDPMHPHSLSPVRKWLAVLTVSMGSLCVTCTSSIFSTTYDQIRKDFNSSHEVATLGLSLFVWGMALGPLILGPLSELYGRRIIYLSTLVLFLIWLVPCAIATNIQTLLISRFFDGFFGSPFLSVAGGTVGDMFPRVHLALPMMIYTTSPFIGPELGPLLGGFINQLTNWQWTFYALICWAAAVIVLIYFLVPETYEPVLLKRKTEKIRQEHSSPSTLDEKAKEQADIRTIILRSISRPIMLLVLEPMCLCLCIYSALLLGIIYLFFGAFQIVFESVYGFELWQVGLSFLGLLVGMVLAVLSDPYWRSNYRRLERNHQLANGDSKFLPEWRLPPAIAGAPLVTVGLFMFAWTTYSSVHWIVPIIGSAIFGAGLVLVYSGIFTFLVDAYPKYAASALAANSFTRATFGGIFPLFGDQMYQKLGIHWASCLLAFLTLAMLPFPYIFYRYGAQIRGKSHFAT